MSVRIWLMSCSLSNCSPVSSTRRQTMTKHTDEFDDLFTDDAPPNIPSLNPDMVDGAVPAIEFGHVEEAFVASQQLTADEIAKVFQIPRELLDTEVKPRRTAVEAIGDALQEPK